MKKPRDPGMPSSAFDPGIDVGTGDVPVPSSAAFTPTLQPASDSARSAMGGASAAITPSHTPITNPRSQTEADLMDTEQKIAAFQPKKLGFWKGMAGAYLPALQPHLTGDYENEYNLQKAAALQKIISTQASADWMSGRNPTSVLNTNTKAGASEYGADTRAGASEYGADQRLTGTEYSADKRLQGTQANLGPMLDVSPELQDQFGAPPKLPVRQLNALETAAKKPLTVVQGQNGASVVNEIGAGAGLTGGQTRNLGLGSPSNARAVQVVDPNNLGQTMMETAGEATRTHAAGTGSASLQVPRQAAKAAVPTGIGDLKVGFTTAISHAQLLRDAAKALNNGDQQTLNGLKNAFKTEFGYSGPITAQAISDAYGSELTNVISKGHMTDAEAAKTGKTIDLAKQNPATVDSVLSAYQALMKSKMDNLDKQTNSAVANSQRRGANFPTGNGAGNSAGGGPAGAQQPPPGANKADPLGIR